MLQNKENPTDIYPFGVIFRPYRTFSVACLMFKLNRVKRQNEISVGDIFHQLLVLTLALLYKLACQNWSVVISARRQFL